RVHDERGREVVERSDLRGRRKEGRRHAEGVGLRAVARDALVDEALESVRRSRFYLPSPVLDPFGAAGCADVRATHRSKRQHTGAEAREGAEGVEKDLVT